MNATKLGLRITSSVLATALTLAPVNGALAAPPDEVETPEAEGETPEDAEGEGTEVEAPEGETPAEGETAEGETAEGETPEGEDVAAEGEGEGEGDAEAEAEGEDDDSAEALEAYDEAEAEAEAEAPDEEIPLAADAPLRPAEPTWGQKERPMNGKGMMITGGLVTGLGAAFIVTAVMITRCDFDSAISCKLSNQRDFLVPVAITATGLGLMLLGVGVGNHVKYKRWENWAPEAAFVPTMVPGGGGGVAMVGRF